MGNIYQVVEKGSIKCACGGKVVLKSSSPNMVIGDSKPLYWRDLLGANIIGCPSNSPCTKVSTITSLGTEKNVADSYSSFLLRTDGFKSNKGREIVLIDSGQHTSSIPPTPTSENSVVDFEKDIIETSQEDRKKIHSTKYRLYLLRRSKDELKPLRPTRAFRNSKETSQIEEETLLTYQVYTHTFAYLYITQESIIKEYKVAYKGQAYNETFLDIYFIDENNHKLDFIPIEKDNEIKISYSNFKLNITKDKSIIDKLDKTTIKPSNIGNIKEKAFYSTQASSLNFKSLDIKEPIFESYSNHKPNLKSDKNINIFCVIDDILGEIEDRYFELENSFKYAYKLNNSYISKVQEINSYPVTITSILDYFYLKEKDEKLLEEIEDKYKRVVEIYLTDKTIIKNIFAKDNGKLDWIFEKDEFDTGLAYILKFKQIKYSLFEEFEINPANKNPSTYYKIDKNRFQAVGYNFSYHTRNSKDYLKSTIFLDNSDSKFTLIKDNANELLASVIFATIFSEKFDELLNNEILNLAKEIDKILQKLKPTPYLNDDKKEDLKAEINKNEIYKEVLSLEENNGKDSYLDDYARLDLVCRKNSFVQDGKVIEKEFKSNYLHFPTKEQSNDKENSLLEKLFKLSQDNEVKFYKKAKDNSELRFPKEILDEIKALLVSAELKNILNIYKELKYEKDEEKLTYIIGLKNIVHLLCASRLNIDEEQEINSIFNPELKHILEFEEYIIKEKNTLKPLYIKDLITEYKITQAHSYLLQKSYIFAMLKGKEFRANAENFTEKYKKEANQIKEDIAKENEPKLHRFVEVEKIKIIKESFEFIKNVEGITSKVEEALDKVLKDKDLPDKHETILKYQASLKNFSNVFAVLKVVDFLIDEKDKKLIDYANFANDTIVLFKIVNSVLKISNGMKEIDFIKAVINKLKGNNIYSNLAPYMKINIFMQTIITILEVNDYKEKRDYSATNLTILAASVSLALLILIPNPTTLVVIVTALSSIIFSISIGLIKDSELTTFLKRTIFAKTGISTEFIAYGPYIDKDKNYNQIVYNPYFLDKAFKTKEKPNNTLEFKTSKELIKFIGNNYKNKKELFDLAFKNELQFLYTTLVGMKLEIDERRIQEGNITKQTNLKIPKMLIDDENAQFLLNGGKYDVKDRKLFRNPNDNDYYLFDLYRYYDKGIHTIILNSSIVNLKYEFEYKYSYDYDLYAINKNPQSEYYEIKNFKQTSFK